MENAGNNGFAILTVVFILGTYALALSLENIIDQWERFRHEKWGKPGKPKTNGDGNGRRDDGVSRGDRLCEDFIVVV